MGLTRIRAEQISDIDYKQAVRVITLTNITLSGGAPATVDGVSLVTGDRVLVAGQSNAAQNGLYSVQTLGTGSDGTWIRTSDGNEDGEIQPGMVVMVTQGTAYADTPWKLTTNGEIEIGVTELTFAENYSLAFGNIFANGTAVIANVVSAAITFEAGNNVSITGNNTTKTVTIAATGGGGGGTPGGANTEVQFNDSGAFGATAGFTFDKTINAVATTGTITASGNITGGNLSGTSIVGTLTTAAQTNITSVGTLGSLTVTGNISGGNLTTAGAVAGNGRALTSLDASNLDTGTVATGRLSGTYTITVSGAATTAGTVTTAAQPNITSVGTLTSLTSSGNIQGANVIATADVFTPEIVKTGSNGAGNIGQSNNTFNTVFAKATSAQYADVAERYLADADYPVGTVLVFGGNKEVTQSQIDHTTAIAGTVSDQPAYVMNAGLTGDHVITVALLGRVPVRVIGTIRPGDLLVASEIPGVATSLVKNLYAPGCVIGKALQSYDSQREGVIEAVVGRL